MNAMHRIGLIVPSSNTTMETELPALLRAREREQPQDTFTFHAARLRMQHVTPEALLAMNAQTERATTELADMRPNVVATACLVAIMAQGPKHHCVVQAEIESILDARARAGAGGLLGGRARGCSSCPRRAKDRDGHSVPEGAHAARRRLHRGCGDRGWRRAQPRGLRQPGCSCARSGGPQDPLEAPRPA